VAERDTPLQVVTETFGAVKRRQTLGIIDDLGEGQTSSGRCDCRVATSSRRIRQKGGQGCATETLLMPGRGSARAETLTSILVQAVVTAAPNRQWIQLT
jgi:hypothetical protein